LSALTADVRLAAEGAAVDSDLHSQCRERAPQLADHAAQSAYPKTPVDASIARRWGDASSGREARCRGVRFLRLGLPGPGRAGAGAILDRVPPPRRPRRAAGDAGMILLAVALLALALADTRWRWRP